METPVTPQISLAAVVTKSPSPGVVEPETTKKGDDGEETVTGKHLLSEEILKLIQRKQVEFEQGKSSNNLLFKLLSNKNMTNNDSILSEIQKEWEQAEADKIKYQKMYEKEKQRVANYKSQTVSAFEKSEKADIELNSVRNQFEALQQKHEVMEEVYIKLRQDLTSMMDKYGKLEYEYNKIKNKLKEEREKRNEFSLDDDDDDAVSVHIDDTYD